MTNISFTTIGKGQPVILLHGFPMNKKVWADYAPALAEDFQITLIDLPGFGDSTILPGSFTIDDVASELVSFTQSQQVKNSVLIGHSLGGYVALSMIEKSSDLFSAFVLFHSTAYPDNDEKKSSRNKILDFIKKNGVDAFTSNFIGPLFAGPHPGIETVKKISIEASEAAVVGYTKAMRDRRDYSHVFREFKKPVLLIGGEKDPGIPADSLRKQAALAPAVEVKILEDTGHMGMFEAREKTLKVLKNFIQRNSVTK